MIDFPKKREKKRKTYKEKKEEKLAKKIEKKTERSNNQKKLLEEADLSEMNTQQKIIIYPPLQFIWI